MKIIKYKDRIDKDRESLLKEIFDFKKENPYNESTKGVTNGIENNSSKISQGSRSTLSDESAQFDVRNNRTDRTGIQANYPNMEIERGSLIAQAAIQASKLQEIPLILIDQSPKE